MQEITKGIAESMKLAENNDQPAAMLPELSPGRAPYAGMTLEETVAELKQHPMFMTDLDADNVGDNEELAAMQALAFDGTPLENAANFKGQGNECFRGRRWADAKEFYTQGIALLVAEERRRAGLSSEEEQQQAQSPEKSEPAPTDASQEGQPNTEDDADYNRDDPDEVRKQKQLLEQLYGNRAACHLELRNYRSCTSDCAGALRLNARNVKALYRSAKALAAVGRVAEAVDACARGLAVDPDNAALRAVEREIAAQISAAAAARRRDEERAEQARHRERLRRAAVEARGIRMRTSGPGTKPPDMEDARVQLVPDPSDPASTLAVPTLLLYPLHFETDFIKAFNETETLDQHLAGYVLPPPWDRKGLYSTAAGVECFAETAAGGLVRVGRKAPLLKLLSGGAVEIVDELLRIYVVPKAKADGWVKDFKAKKAAEKGGGSAPVAAPAA